MFGDVNFLGTGGNLTFDSSTGNVGIGTTSPTGALDVRRAIFPVLHIQRDKVAGAGIIYAAADLELTNTTPTAGNGPGFYFKAPNDSGDSKFAGIFGGGLTDITAGAEIGYLLFTPSWQGADPFGRRDMRLTATGSGIYETNLRLGSPILTAGTIFQVEDDASNAHLARFFTNDSTTDDLAGISFGVHTSASSRISKSAIVHQRKGSWGQGDLVFLVDPNNDEADVDIGNEVMRLQGSSGNVGIGTTVPTDLFNVNGDSNFAGDVLIEGDLNVEGSISIEDVTFLDGGIIATGDSNFASLQADNAYFTNQTTTGDSNFVGPVLTEDGLYVKGTEAEDMIRSDIGFEINAVIPPTNNAAIITPIEIAGNIDAGTHYYYISFYTAIGETGLSANTSPSFIDANASHGQVNITNIPISSDHRVIGRKIYRNEADDFAWVNTKLLTTITNNVDTTYVDNTADAGLTGDNSYWREDTTTKQITKNGESVFMAGSGREPGTIFGTRAGATTFAGTATGGANTLIGYSAGRALTTGNKVVAIGYNALDDATTSVGTIAIGWGTGQRITTGGANVNIGYGAGWHNVTGGSNTAVGHAAGQGVSGNSYNSNVLIGRGTGYSVTTSSYNTIIGTNAGYDKTTGNYNIFLGYYAGRRQTTSSNLLIIDNTSRADTATEETNAIIYGVMAAAPADQTLRVNADLNVTEHLYVDGNANVNFVFGTAWYHNHGGMVFNFDTANVWYKFNMTTNNRLNGLHMVDGNFQIEADGLYRIDYSADGAGQNNHHYVTSVLINDLNQDNCSRHHTLPAANDVVLMGNFCYLDLYEGDYVTVAVMDEGGTGAGTVYNYDVVIERKGKYGLGA